MGMKIQIWLRGGAHVTLVLDFTLFINFHGISSYTFTWDHMKSFESDTGLYHQYAYVRLASIWRKTPRIFPRGKIVCTSVRAGCVGGCYEVAEYSALQGM